MGAPSGAVAVRDEVWRVVNPGLDANTYIVRSDAASGCVLVDPGMATADLDAALHALGVVPRLVLCTHGHFDHIAGAAHVQRAHGCRVLLHEADRRTAQAANLLMMAMGVPGRIELPAFEYLTGDEGRVVEGTVALRHHHAPGHTPGSCVFAHDDLLFTGDTLFTQGIDATRFPGGSPERLRASIDLLCARFPDEATVCPGHGTPRTLGWVKAHNRPLQAFLAAQAEPA